MKKLIVAVSAAVVLAAAGCKSPGRFTGAEINSLSPEQMQALAVSDAFVYQSDTATAARAADVTAEKGGVPWLDALKAVVSAKWRVSVIKVEWGRPAATAVKQ